MATHEKLELSVVRDHLRQAVAAVDALGSVPDEVSTGANARLVLSSARHGEPAQDVVVEHVAASAQVRDAWRAMERMRDYTQAADEAAYDLESGHSVRPAADLEMVGRLCDLGAELAGSAERGLTRIGGLQPAQQASDYETRPAAAGRTASELRGRVGDVADVAHPMVHAAREHLHAAGRLAAELSMEQLVVESGSAPTMRGAHRELRPDERATIDLTPAVARVDAARQRLEAEEQHAPVSSAAVGVGLSR